MRHLEEAARPALAASTALEKDRIGATLGSAARATFERAAWLTDKNNCNPELTSAYTAVMKGGYRAQVNTFRGRGGFGRGGRGAGRGGTP